MEIYSARTERLDRTCREIRRYIFNSASFDRDDRLFPAHYRIFETNPLSLAYGACGTALFLRNHLCYGNEEITDWILSHPLDTDHYPPGLHLGLAGIAFVLSELDRNDAAENCMDVLHNSPLLFEDPGMSLGAAGWGMVSLSFYQRTGSERFIRRAIAAAEFIQSAAESTDAGAFWRSGLDKQVHYGYGHGASGIAYFLSSLAWEVKSKAYSELALRALRFEVAHGTLSQVGLQWPDREGSSVIYPYLMYGTAGVGAVLVRCRRLLGTEEFDESIRKAADAAMISYAFCPGLFEGLAGIGEFMLDLYFCTGEERYIGAAADIADAVLLFEVEKESGIAFPGRWLSRVSCDYATGSAGIGSFLHRLLRREQQRLGFDLCT